MMNSAAELIASNTHSHAKYLECWHLSKSFDTPRGRFIAVRDFTLNVTEGEFVSIMGTVVAAEYCPVDDCRPPILGRWRHDSGQFRSARRIPIELWRGFNRQILLPWFSALENVLLAVQQVEPRLPQETQRSIAAGWLERVGLGRAIDKKTCCI